MNRYLKILESLKEKHFLAVDGSGDSEFINMMSKTLEALRDKQGFGPVYGKTDNEIDSDDTLKSEIPKNYNESISDLLLNEIGLHAQNSIVAGHPMMLKNIIPLPHISYLITTTLLSILMPNGVTGADAGQILESEKQCAVALAKLAGYDHTSSRGIFTFGGTATNLYAIKIGLNKALFSNSTKGVREDVVVIGSRSAHYSHLSSVDWLGIGTSNFISVNTNEDQTVDIDNLKEILEQNISSGKKIACIILSGGTTSCMGIDDFKAIYDIRNDFVKKYNLNYYPHIHADSVLGWVYLNFNEYNFRSNPLNFRRDVLDKICSIFKRISTIKYADSFGVDFHKSGYVPYISSMIIAKNEDDLISLSKDKEITTPLFHENSSYEPGKFTLETSRNSASMVGTWYTLKSLGKEGYMSLLGHSQAMWFDLQKKFQNVDDIVVVNKNSFGSDLFIRLYPVGSNAREIFDNEKNNPSLLKNNNEYTNKIFKFILNNHYFGDNGIAVSKSSAAFYTKTDEPVQAIRIYILNPYIDKNSINQIFEKIIEIKKEFDKISIKA